jgi:excisionase family DNA binding protein
MATNVLLDKAPVLPSERDTQLATESSRKLAAAARDTTNEFRVTLEGGVELTLPSAVKTLLIHLLTEMSQGNAVTIIPVHAELTTQEAANFLNVSRPHVISLLNKGEIKHHMTGTHRKIRFVDLQKYMEKRTKESEDAMAALTAQAQELGMGY